MTDFSSRSDNQRDRQDHVERGMWGDLAYQNGAGAYLKIRGTGTVDEEVTLLNLGYGFNLPVDSNAEMVMLSLGSDVNDKVALASIPRDKQHPWGQGQGGVQHPTNPDRRVEFNDDELWLRDGNFALGDNKEVKVIVSGGVVTITTIGATNITSGGAMTISAPDVEITSGTLTHNGVNIGDDHRHGGVDTGGGVSGGPQ